MKHLLILFTLFLTLHSGNVAAKENQDLIKANYYYNHFAFHEAIPFFEKVADQVNNPVVFAQLGDCFRLTGNLEKAAANYDKAVKMQGCSSAVMLRYGQVLMQLTRYSEAEKWLKAYQKTNIGDRRAANLIAGCGYAQNAQKDGAAGTAILLAFNTDGAEFAPTLWKGRLVFTSDTVIDLKKKKDNWTGRAYYNIYSVGCDDKGNCGTDIDKVADAKALNIKYHNGPCTFSADGKQMYFTRTRYNDKFFSQKSVSNKDSIVLLEIMIASGYDEKEKKFKEIVPFQYNNAEYTVAHPSLSPNGKVLVFSSNMDKGAGGSDLYICKKMTGAKWSKPVSVGNAINTEGEEVFPFWADDNTLYFSSDGHEGLGGLDIYKSRWNEQLNTFSTPENAGAPVNSSYDDISLAMFADGRSTYFSSNRPAEKGGDNIYFYKREKVFLQINVKDSATQQPIAGAKISMKAAKDSKDKETGNSGGAFAQLDPGAEYRVSISKDEYETKEIIVNATGNKEIDTLSRSVQLAKIPVIVRDTIPVVKAEEPVAIKYESIMDSPGIRQFEVDKTYEVGHFYFDYNKSDLREVHRRFLDTLMTQLTRHPTMRVELRAHTDCRGSVASNQVLSNNRALLVVNYLVEHGISRKRLEYRGMGSSQPAVKCPTDCNSCTEEQHSLNRVLELKVLHL